MFNVIIQIICVLCAIATLWLIGDKKEIGFIIGIVAQIFWIILFLNIHTYWLLITSLIYGGMYLRGWLLWRAQRKYKKEN